MNGRGIELKVFASNGMVDVRTPFLDRQSDFVYASIAGMYKPPHTEGVACQVNDEAMRADIEAMGRKITEAIREFGMKYPELGVHDERTLAVQKLIYGGQDVSTAT